MKILIVSDTHRQNSNFIKVIQQVGRIDLVIHLGDAQGSEYFLSEQAGCPMEIISGNNDFFTSLPKEKEIILGNYKVLLTHGHYYYVTVGMEQIRREAIERGFDIVMFGHTHRPIIEISKDVTLINPGSLSYPRQEGRRPSFILMEIDDEGEAHYTINYL